MSLPKPVNELDYETGAVIRTFKSIRALTDFHDVDPQAIRYAMKHCGGKMKIRRLRFAYVEENLN